MYGTGVRNAVVQSDVDAILGIGQQSFDLLRRAHRAIPLERVACLLTNVLSLLLAAWPVARRTQQPTVESEHALTLRCGDGCP